MSSFKLKFRVWHIPQVPGDEIADNASEIVQRVYDAIKLEEINNLFQ